MSHYEIYAPKAGLSSLTFRFKNVDTFPMHGRLKVILFCVTLGFSFLAQAENHLVYFGGGSSRFAKEDSMFDRSFSDTLAYAKSKKLNADFFYREALPQGLSPADAEKIKKLTTSSFKEKIRELTRSINSGKIKPGEQLLVYLDTHGELTNEKYTLTTDGGYANGEDLQYLIKAAEKKGVKLGIIGATCYSGSLMKYKTPHTCIIAASQPDKVGFYGDAVDISAGAFGLGNLEDMYLETRDSGAGVLSQPMISTEAGIRTDEILSPLKRTIIADTDRRSELAKPICKNPTASMSALEDEIKSLQNGSRERPEWAESEIKNLRELIEQYNSTQLNVQAYSAAKDKLTCMTTPNMKGNRIEPSTKQCLSQEYIEWKIARLPKLTESREIDKDLPAGTKKPERLAFAYLLDLLESEDYKNYQRLKQENKAELSKLNDLSFRIAVLERDIYNKAYKKASKESTGPNPCRDFKL